MTNCVRWVRVVLLVWMLAACGGGGGDSGPTGTPIAERIDVGPQAALLTQAGERRQLTAIVRDTSGQTMQAALEWSSSDVSMVSVDANGQLRAEVAAGSAWITARSGSVTSAPVLVMIAQPVAGVHLLEDRQFVSGPIAVLPDAEPAVGAFYEVVLRDIANLMPGTLLVSAEAAPVAGRVETVTDAGDGRLLVRLATVPVWQLFTSWSFSNRVALAQMALEVPPELAALYTVERVGDRFDFTPRPGTPTGHREHRTAVQGTRALGPFGCEGAETPTLPMVLTASPLFSVTVTGDATFDATPAGTRLRLTSQPVLKVTAEVGVASAFELKLECRAVLLHGPVRVPGWAGLFFGGEVTVGAGLEVGGKVTLLAAKLGGTAELKPTINVDLRCGIDCELDGDVVAGPFVAKPVLQAPSIDQVQFEPSAALFAFVDLKVGGPVSALQFEAVKSKAGVGLGANLTLESLQIGNLHAEEGRSKYELKFAGEVGPGIKLGGLLNYLGLNEVVPLKLTFEESLGTSPTGTVTADHASYGANAPVTVTVMLDSASTKFPAGSSFYNVERIVLLRRVDSASVEVLASANATEGQTTFTLAFTNGANNLLADEIYAFVVTKALPLDPPRLEIGGAPTQAAIEFKFDNDLEGWAPGGNAIQRDLEGQGVARLDGSDGGTSDGQPNSWISRAIDIPAHATTLSFQTSAHNRVGADSALRVRLVKDGVSHTLLDWEVLTSLSVSETNLFYTFVDRSANIAAFAGQTVTIFFEQGDNDDGIHEQRYLDNIRIH